VVGSVTYYDSWDYKTNLLNGSTGEVLTALPIVTGASGGSAGVPGLVGASTVQRLQVDLLWKF
jgi:hypothetical protein